MWKFALNLENISLILTYRMIMLTKKLLALLAVTSLAISGLSQGAIALFIDDFKDDIGNNGEGEFIFFDSANRQAFFVSDADPSDMATVAQTTPAGTSRTALATATTGVGGVVVGGFATFQSGGLGGLIIQVNDGSPSDTANLSFEYDFTPVLDATSGGLLDTVEIEIGSTDWSATKGTFSVDFVDAGTGDFATWLFTPDIPGQVESALLSSLPLTPAVAMTVPSVDFSNISDVTFRVESAYDLDIAMRDFGLSGPPVPEPGSALLALIGSGVLIARRRRV